MSEIGVQTDPLESPHPIPWNWVLATHSEICTSQKLGIRYYRSPSLLSPDGQYAAYSRIQMHPEAELYYSKVTSVMFVENLKTGDLRTIKGSSPFADNPLSTVPQEDIPGTISILMPISWSPLSDRLLARQFEGIFSTSDASDYAVIWDRKQNTISTLAPQPIDYSFAVLLGWSQTNTDQILFRTGEMGIEYLPLWTVDLNGKTTRAPEQEPMIFGKIINQVWAGPQSRW
jgi:hypothetical protein